MGVILGKGWRGEKKKNYPDEMQKRMKINQ